jgi:hypothetical protein
LDDWAVRPLALSSTEQIIVPSKGVMLETLVFGVVKLLH